MSYVAFLKRMSDMAAGEQIISRADTYLETLQKMTREMELTGYDICPLNPTQVPRLGLPLPLQVWVTDRSDDYRALVGIREEK